MWHIANSTKQSEFHWDAQNAEAQSNDKILSFESSRMFKEQRKTFLS